MKKNRKVHEAISPSILIEERNQFANQGKTVLASYRMARLSIAMMLPCFSACGLFFPRMATVFAVVVGSFLFFALRKKFGAKGAAAPGITALVGTGTGFFLLSPLLSRGMMLKEALYGF